MRRSTIFLVTIFAVGCFLTLLYTNHAAWGKGSSQDAPAVSIFWPKPGQALLGNIEISGNTTIEGFVSAELLFGYANDSTNTWFLITQSDLPIENAVLANWDTTIISDGNYNLKLSVTRQDGSQVFTLIQGVRVRNYSPIEPDTPTPVTPTLTQVPGDTPVPTVTPTPTITPIPPTATPLPTNPVVLTSNDIIAGFGRGALVVLALFIFLGAYMGVRSMIRNRA